MLNKNTAAFFSSERASFYFGGLLGILFFLLSFGWSTLDVTNVNWMIGKGDLSQHYFGWCFFRNGDWLFPFGCTNMLSYPLTSSVIYTDSIPLLAIFFKLFRYILPASFQYFGWFGLIVYSLQGAVSALLIKRLTHNTFYALLSSLFFILSTTMMQRIFAHTALSSHFIILLCLLMLLTDRHPEKYWRSIIIWSLLLILSMSIHFYFVPVVLLFLLFYAIKRHINQPKAEHRWRHSFLLLFIPAITLAFATFCLGGLTSDVVPLHCADGNPNLTHTASANLNTFYNSLGWMGSSTYLHSSLPYASCYQYEGFCYLGLGILLGFSLLIIILIINALYPLRICNKNNWHSYKHTNIWMLFCIATIFFILALSPSITFNERTLFTYPLWQPIETLWTVFQSTGRFIWPVAYILLLVLITGFYRIFKCKWASFFCLLILLSIQIIDLAPWIQQTSSEKIATVYTPSKNYSQIEKIIANKKHVCFSECFYYEIDNYCDILNAAAVNKASINTFYFARTFDGYRRYIKENAINSMRHPSPDILYVLIDDNLERDTNTCSDLDIMHIDFYTLATAKHPH